MTTRPAVIQATYATWRPDERRKVLKLTFEVPIEKQAEVLAILGAPGVDTSEWYAIARLAENGPGPAASARTTPSAVSEGQDKDTALPVKQGKRFNDLPRSQQAAIKLQNPEFVEWLVENFWKGGSQEYDADALLKSVLGIASKKELDTDPMKAAAWDALRVDYELRGYQR